MKKKLLVAATLAFISAGVLADDIDADAYIEYREHLMENAKNHTKGISNILKGKLLLKENILLHARALHEVTLMIPSAFPEGSDFGETSAKAGVWDDAEGFTSAARKNKAAVGALVKAAESGNTKAVGEAMANVGKTCKGCHKKYREKR